MPPASNPRRKSLLQPSIDLVTELEKLASDPLLGLVLVGHLWIEAMLVKALQLGDSTESAALRMNWPEKVETCVARGLIPPDQEPVYLQLNELRNDYGHIFGHKLTESDLESFLELINESSIEDNDGLLRGPFDEDSDYDMPSAVIEAVYRMGSELTYACLDKYDSQDLL